MSVPGAGTIARLGIVAASNDASRFITATDVGLASQRFKSGEMDSAGAIVDGSKWRRLGLAGHDVQAMVDSKHHIVI